MHVGLVLEMTHSGLDDRMAITADGSHLSHRQLAERSWAAAARFAALDTPAVIYLGGNHLAFPLALFGAAAAGVPFVPLNYRLAPEQIRDRLDAHPGALVIHQGSAPAGADAGRVVDQQAFTNSLDDAVADPTVPCDPDEPCVLLYTSGTTSAPKAAVLRHRHLMSYLLGTVEFGGAAEDEAALVTVPPVPRRRRGQPAEQCLRRPARRLPRPVRSRVVAGDDPARARDPGNGGADHAGPDGRLPDGGGREERAGTPSLRTISYGGAPMPVGVLRRAMGLFPEVGFVNAYGLTETSSTIALLDPDDHRAAFSSDDAAVRDRLQSVGRLLPGVELEVRDEDGRALGHG